MFIKRKISVWIGMIIAAFVASSTLIPVTLAQQYDVRHVVKMAYVDFPPYSFTNQNGQPSGLAIDLAQRLLNQSEYALEFVPAADPGAMMNMLQSGEVDMSSLLGLTDSRLAMAKGTKQLGSFKSVLFTKRNNSAHQLSDFHGKRIGAVTGSLAVASAQTIPFARIVEYANPDAQIIGLLAGDVDAVVGALDSFSARLRTLGVDLNIASIEPALGVYPYGFFVADTRPDLFATLNTEITNSLSLEDLRALADIWFGTPTRLVEHDVIFWGSVVVMCLLALASILAIRSRWAARHIGALEKENKEHQLLIDALDGVQAAMIIYDKDLNAIHWNGGFVAAFPKMVTLLENGATLHSLVAGSYKNGTMSGKVTSAAADALADDVVRRLRGGQKVERVVHTSDGRTLETTELALGTDHFASVRVDVTKLYSQAQLIKDQKTALENVNAQLKMFATIAAHDLKAPLVQQASLLQFIEDDMNEAKLDLPAGVSDYFALLGTLSTKMRRLVTDLLEHAKSTNISDRIETLDLNERIPQILDLTGLPEKFTVEIEPELPTVSLDPVSFDTVIRNLISNAFKHHDQDVGKIQIRGRHENGFVVLEIEDDGPGIDAKYRESIFEPFKRLSSKSDSTGLGLSFTQTVVEQWGGEISVECPHDRGSTFVIKVPDHARPKTHFVHYKTANAVVLH